MKMLYKKEFNIASLTLFLLIGSTSTVASDTIRLVAKSDSKPNIILILADDMSWFDVGAYHKRFDRVPKNAITPNIDKIGKCIYKKLAFIVCLFYHLIIGSLTVIIQSFH